MKAWQRGIQYAAMALAVALCVAILGGIVSGLFFLSGVLGHHRSADADAGASLGEVRTYTPAGSITGLELELGAATLTIRTGDAFRLESNLTQLTVQESDGVWKIRQKQTAIFSYANDAYCHLTMPADAALDTVKLDTSAGKVDIDTLTAAVLDFDLGAGKFRAGSLTATKEADIDGGAGQLVIEDVSLHELDMDMGVGKTELTARLTGDCSLDMGVGATELTLLGSREDYRLNIEKGVGRMTVDGDEVQDGTVIGTGAAAVKLSGGVGRVTVELCADSAE